MPDTLTYARAREGGGPINQNVQVFDGDQPLSRVVEVDTEQGWAIVLEDREPGADPMSRIDPRHGGIKRKLLLSKNLRLEPAPVIDERHE